MNERFKDESVGEAMLLARAAVGALLPEQMRRRHEQSLRDDEADRQRQLVEDARLVRNPELVGLSRTNDESYDTCR